jgi:hypothetical protein
MGFVPSGALPAFRVLSSIRALENYWSVTLAMLEGLLVAPDASTLSTM